MDFQILKPSSLKVCFANEYDAEKIASKVGSYFAKENIFKTD